MIDKPKAFMDEVVKEMKKVSWPDKDSLVSSSYVVVVISVVFTLFIYFSDILVSFIATNFLYVN